MTYNETKSVIGTNYLPNGYGAVSRAHSFMERIAIPAVKLVALPAVILGMLFSGQCSRAREDASSNTLERVVVTSSAQE